MNDVRYPDRVTPGFRQPVPPRESARQRSASSDVEKSCASGLGRTAHAITGSTTIGLVLVSFALTLAPSMAISAWMLVPITFSLIVAVAALHLPALAKRRTSRGREKGLEPTDTWLDVPVPPLWADQNTAEPSTTPEP